MLAKRYLQMSRVTNPLLTFDHGEDCLDYLKEVESGKHRMPAMLLMDVRMPILDGFDVVKQVRENPFFAALPVVMMFSNSNEEADIRKSKEVGANGYQVKPQSGDEYVKFWNSLVEEPSEVEVSPA